MKVKAEKYWIDGEERYRLIDENSNVVDDAQGYGFKTAQGAHKAYYFNQNRATFEEKNKKIFEFLKTSQPILKFFRDNKWRLETFDVEEIMTYHDLDKFIKENHVESEFKPKDIYRVLTDFKQWKELKKFLK